MKTGRISAFMNSLHLLWIILPIVFAILQIYVFSVSTKLGMIDAFLLNFLWISVGLQGTLTGISEIFNGKKPLMRKLGYASLAFGILGLLCPLIGGTWWAATGIGYSLLLVGSAAERLYDLIENKNFSFWNIDLSLWSDMLVPFVLLMFISWHYGTILQIYLA